MRRFTRRHGKIVLYDEIRIKGAGTRRYADLFQ